MNKFMKKMVVIAMAAVIMLPALASNAQVDENTAKLFGGSERADALKSGSLGGDRDPRDIAASVINVIMGFLGIVAVVIILLGGFKWMTAAGSEDKIDEAKKLLAAGVIGLVIILSAWGIATFVLKQILSSTSTTA